MTESNKKRASVMVAVAVLTKTPGLTPVKRRLAASIGAAAAEKIYRISLDATAAVVRAAARRAPMNLYFAVPENEGLNHPFWNRRQFRGFSTMPTGGGSFGARLYNVQKTLVKTHRRVILIGGDCPHMPPQVLARAAARPFVIGQPRAVFGPAADGGFYLFAYDGLLQKRIFTAAPYSQNNTLRRLLAAMNSPAEFLPVYADIDDEASLKAAITRLARAPLPAQKKAAANMRAALKLKVKKTKGH